MADRLSPMSLLVLMLITCITTLRVAGAVPAGADGTTDDCNNCPASSAVVCAAAPSGVSETYQNRCFAKCSGATDIHPGACHDAIERKIQKFKGVCKVSKAQMDKHATEGLVFLGCIDNTSPDAPTSQDVVDKRGAANTRKLDSLFAGKTGSDPFVLTQHLIQATDEGDLLYYARSQKITLAELHSMGQHGLNAVSGSSMSRNPSGSILGSDQPGIPATGPSGTVGRKLRQIVDNRYQVTNTQQYPFWNMGQLTYNINSGSFLCSGTFISPDDVLTAGHCVIDSVTGTFYSNWVFTPAKSGANAPYGIWGWSGVTAWSAWLGCAYNGGNGATCGSAYLDTAIIYTNRISSGWNSIGGLPCGSSVKSMTSCGYPGDKGGSQLWCSNGTTVAIDYCDTVTDRLSSSNMFLAGGMSGGPVMERNPASSGIGVRAVNSGSSTVLSVYAPIDTYTSAIYMSMASIYSSTWSFKTTAGTIVSSANSRCLTLPNFANFVTGTQLLAQTCIAGNTAQRWWKPTGYSWEVRITNSAGSTFKCMTVRGGATANGTPIELRECSGVASQKFFYDKVQRLRPFYAPTKCVNQDTVTGNVQLWDCSTVSTQKWV